MHRIQPNHIYIFSPVAATDYTYLPVLKFLIEGLEKKKGLTAKLKLFDAIDMEAIGLIVNK